MAGVEAPYFAPSRQQVEISPTYISSDLLSPDQKGRITIPTRGSYTVETPPLGKETWGQNVTNYGGIGQLTFLGRARSRDLEVTRGHKHFGSGFSKYSTKVQPYRLTPLILSSCRLNDQILPPIFQEYLDPDTYVIPSNLPKKSYFSHTSKCEVFPKNDPERYNSESAPVLTKGTSDALKSFYHELHSTPSYKLFPDNSRVIQRDIQQRRDLQAEHGERERERRDEKTAREVKLQQRQYVMPFYEEICQLLSEAPGPACLVSCLLKLLDTASMDDIVDALRKLSTDSKTSNDLKEEQRHLASYIIQMLEYFSKSNSPRERLRRFLHAYKNSLGEAYSVTTGKTSPNAATSNTLSNETQNSQSNKIPSPPLVTPIPTDHRRAPRWPPSRCGVLDQKKLRLKEIESLIPKSERESNTNTVIRSLDGKVLHSQSTKPKPLDNSDLQIYVRSRVKESLNNSTSEEGSRPIPGFPSYKAFLEQFLPVKLDYGRERSEEVLAEQGSVLRGHYLPPVSQSCLHDRTQDVATVSPLSACLHPTGTRIQDHLGLRFKTEAHRRFHKLYPDKIPDLRDSEVQRKSYFFYGYHASAFRG